ncbi:hypothetical protein EG68_10820 [Paragonimus skrjabini miyazakii]|uniref:Uncharacterized protein n=1 Tax=Paragonimus skrjabini miyazakii TaxID=59628 RepID=A0A8S9YM35_9TREM|nr:hypothetical protein EG68_10820 [Paragonimus skrjabini miyazakii]
MEPRSMEEALSTARAYAAAANATGSSLDSTFGAMASSVAESKPAYNASDNHRQFSNCIFCQRFGSAAQRCGHNPEIPWVLAAFQTNKSRIHRCARGQTVPTRTPHCKRYGPPNEGILKDKRDHREQDGPTRGMCL